MFIAHVGVGEEDIESITRRVADRNVAAASLIDPPPDGLTRT
jgi:hypothetical protein